MKTVNIIDAILVVTSGFVRMFTISTTENGGLSRVPLAIVAFYSIVFGFLWLSFEAGWHEKFQERLKRNFGFIFSYYGRMLFICFLATLVLSCPLFGDGAPKLSWVSLTVGIITLINGTFNCYVIYNHPGFTTRGPKEDAAKAGDKGSQKSATKKQASEDVWTGTSSSTRPPAPAPPEDFGGDFYGGSSAAASQNPFGDAPPDEGNGIGNDNPFANI